METTTTTTTTMTFKKFEDFVEENSVHLEKLYSIFNSRLENSLSYTDFTKFCYVKTYFIFG